MSGCAENSPAEGRDPAAKRRQRLDRAFPGAGPRRRVTAIRERLARYQHRVEGVLEHVLELPDAGTARLREGMRYSVLGGGKRLRPLLVYLTGESLGAPLAALDLPAASVALIH